MGACSSTASWEILNYPHPLKKLTCSYGEKDSILVEEKEFYIQDAINLLPLSNLFSEITLILDIDATLGEASRNIFMDPELTPKHLNMQDINRLISMGKAEWIHNGTILFFPRPYFAEFISFCDRNFKEVIIWTNGIQRHADSIVNIVEKIVGKKWRGIGREQINDMPSKKIISKINLDPLTTWMVDDDHNHHSDEFEVNKGMKFFHTPEFSMEFFQDFYQKIPQWGIELDTFDDWFLFLIWNWVHMKNENMEMVSFDRKKNHFTYQRKI